MTSTHSKPKARSKSVLDISGTHGLPKKNRRQAKKVNADSLFQFNHQKDEFIYLFKAPMKLRVKWAKSGLPAVDAKNILKHLHVPQSEALGAFRIAPATVNRKAKTNSSLSPDEGERVLGFGRLIGQVQTMVQESGNPVDFDAAAWLSTWMSSPVPALDGGRPLDLMDTMTGQELVSQLLSQMQSGAYA